jgi:DNA-binding IclR family transcriptional regulator
MDDPDHKTVASVERAFAVLSVFLHGDPVLTLNEIADRTQLYKSTILRLLKTLEAGGYIVRNEEGLYHIGPTPLRLAFSYQNAIQPHDRVLPVLQRLVLATQESASFNIRNETSRLCLYRIDSPQRLRDHIRPGDVLPLYRGAAGRVFEAFSKHPSATRNAAITRIRKAGTAHTEGELESDTAGVAAPVFAEGSHLVGVLAVSGPRSRFTKAKVAEFETLVLQAAEQLSQVLGAGPYADHLHPPA